MARTVILCVDDEKVILETLERQISKSNLGKTFEVEIAESGEEALEIIAELEEEGAELAVLVSDQIMPGMKGDELLIAVNQSHPQTLKILLTGQASLEAVTNAINKARLYRYVAKPWDDTDLMLTIEEAARSFMQYVQIIEYDQHNRLLKSLNTATQEISGATNPKSIAEKLIKSVQLNATVDRIFLLLKDGVSWKVEAFYTIDSAEAQDLTDRSFRDNLTLTNEVFERMKPLMDLPQPVKNSMVIPVERGNEAIGYLFIENNRSKVHFNSNQFEIMHMMTVQTAISLENATLYGSIEEQNKDILDSIYYAKRIQYSLLPAKELLYKHFPDSFVYYQPRDIVSGDFYWYVEEAGYFFIAAVDCTGHGVPGAFMSVLGSTQLNEIVKQSHIRETDQILTEQHERIMLNLGKNEPTAKVNDGMDMALCRFDFSNNELQYAGANRPLLIIREGEIIELQGDKKPIGHSGHYEEAGERRIYTAQTFQLLPGDEVYLFSDGMTDQFGNGGKKLGKKKLYQNLQTFQSFSMKERRAKVTEMMLNWMGNLRQLDDQILIGLRIK